MKESYGERLATDTGPESCGAACEGGVDALTGARAGWVLSRETEFLRDADAVMRILPAISLSGLRAIAGPKIHREFFVPCIWQVDQRAADLDRFERVQRIPKNGPL